MKKYNLFELLEEKNSVTLKVHSDGDEDKKYVCLKLKKEDSIFATYDFFTKIKRYNYEQILHFNGMWSANIIIKIFKETNILFIKERTKNDNDMIAYIRHDDFYQLINKLIYAIANSMVAENYYDDI